MFWSKFEAWFLLVMMKTALDVIEKFKINQKD